MSRRTPGRGPALGAALLIACAAAPFSAGAQAEAPTAATTPIGARIARTTAAGAAPRHAATAGTPAAANSRPCTAVTTDPTMFLTLGKSRVVRLASPAARIVVGGQPSSRAGRPIPVEDVARGAAQRAAPASQADTGGVAETDITLLSPTELFMLGRTPGSMNVVIQGTDGRCVIKDIVVAADPAALAGQLHEVLPEETGIKVHAAESSLVLTGTVSDAVRMGQVLTIAGAYTEPKKLVNLLRVASPQQVMLEVKIAEVSKTLLDRLGLNNFQRAFTNGAGVTSVIQGIIGGGSSLLSRIHGGPGLPEGVSNSTRLGIDANRKDGIVRVLAEPNIVAISGQSASFLSGGKIFIPVAQSQSGGAPTITLEEKEFGVGLKFTPTVLGDVVNLKIISEVSDLSQTGTPFTTVGGTVAVLPSMTTRRVDTTVQLGDGQSFVVAGLIKNNLNEALNKFPGLGEAPVLGALFRSTEFANDQTELMFVVTPRLVRPLAGAVALPTDVHVTPSRSDVMLMGKGEGTRAPATPAAVAPPPATPSAPAAPAPVPTGPTSKAEPGQDALPQRTAPTPVAQAGAAPEPEPQPPGLVDAVAMPVRQSQVRPASASLDAHPL
jgi:pilus assembly protein CpaC